jgi:hypothetical protein
MLRPSKLLLPALLALLTACARSGTPDRPAAAPGPAAPPAEGAVISFTLRTFEKSDGDCTIHLQVPEILKAPTPAARRALQRFIRDEWLAVSFGASQGDDLAALAEGLFRQRREILAANPGVPGRWWVRRGIDILYQDEHVVSLRYGDDSYTGGESPIDEVLLASFDPATGRRLKLADLLVPGAEEPLQALAAERFRQIRHASPGAPLPLDGRFAVVEAGLLFRFNRVEGVEPAQIVLTREELQGLAAADGPLAGRGRPGGAFFPSAGGHPGKTGPSGDLEDASVPR